MPSQQGAQLSQMIKQKVEELKTVCKGLDEKTASRAPAGRWSPKEILDQYTQLTGKSPLPPLWSFGLWMSRPAVRRSRWQVDPGTSA